MFTVVHAPLRVIVVDPCPSDYLRLGRAARQAGFGFYTLGSGAEALRAASRAAVNLWIVNVGLPDMSGFELVERLRPRRRGSDVFLVGDQYRAEDEVRSLSSGVTMYLCKPARAAWLRHWRPTHERAERERAYGSENRARL